MMGETKFSSSRLGKLPALSSIRDEPEKDKKMGVWKRGGGNVFSEEKRGRLSCSDEN